MQSDDLGLVGDPSMLLTHLRQAVGASPVGSEDDGSYDVSAGPVHFTFAASGRVLVTHVDLMDHTKSYSVDLADFVAAKDAEIERLVAERDEAALDRDAGREVYLTLQQSMAALVDRIRRARQALKDAP